SRSSWRGYSSGPSNPRPVVAGRVQQAWPWPPGLESAPEAEPEREEAGEPAPAEASESELGESEEPAFAEASESEPGESEEPASAEASESEPEESEEPAFAEASESEPEEFELETQEPIMRSKSKRK